MRITTGIYKNRRLVMPEGIRPTQDKVRKALFDILGTVEGEMFLELYAGSGAIGLEAASRGASKVIMVENNPRCQKAIEHNIASLKAQNCSLYPYPAEMAIKSFHMQKLRFDTIVLDPPYYQDMAKNTLQTLIAYDILAPNGFIVIQRFKKDDLPEGTGDLTLLKQAKYSNTVLSILQKKA